MVVKHSIDLYGVIAFVIVLEQFYNSAVSSSILDESNDNKNRYYSATQGTNDHQRSVRILSSRMGLLCHHCQHVSIITYIIHESVDFQVKVIALLGI